MKTCRSCLAGAGLVLAGMLAGCTGLTPAAQTSVRIDEKRTAFNRLTPLQQADIRGGAIQRGNTTDMVYMALGRPSRITTSANGENSMWVYIEYYAAGGAASSSLNNPNSAVYLTGMTSANAPGGPASPPPPANAPQFVATAFRGVQSASFSGTTSPGPSQFLQIANMQSKTVYVFFSRGRVAEIKVEGDVSDQASAAPNVRAETQKGS